MTRALGSLLDITQVAYDNYGHCIFLEDGAEHDNVISRNLIVGTKPIDGGQPHALPSDVSGQVSAFWLSNPDNKIEDNVAAAAWGVGFWVSVCRTHKGDAVRHLYNEHPSELPWR